MDTGILRLTSAMAEKDKRVEYLVNGYMRQEYTLHKQYDHFESSLMLIMMEFLGNIFIMFDVYPSKCKWMFSNYGKTFKRDFPRRDNMDAFTFGCSLGWNKGIHKIWIESRASGFGSNAFGITSDIKYFGTNHVWFGHQDGYKYVMNGNLLAAIDDFSDIGSSHHNVFDESESKSGDILQICLNADQWTVTFSLNEKQLGKPMKVKPDQTYHLFISSSGFLRTPCEYCLISDLS